MCGIVGIYHAKGEPISEQLLRTMTNELEHRGPDSHGQFIDGAVGLGHRRLAVIDVTRAGHQPMQTTCGHVTITYNGEIYNFQELRKELEGCGRRFVSRSDTEVVLQAYAEWGEQCIHRFNGMFAFGIYDHANRLFFLGRDRYGTKPLYWFCRHNVLIFASEIKAIRAHPAVTTSLCYSALNEYFTFQNIFSDLTLFEGIRMLPPGNTLTLRLDGDMKPEVRRYWEYPVHATPLQLDDEESAEQVYQLFCQAVRRQLVSDVPVGGYLSGGMDSGSIVAVAVQQIPRLTTFTAGFDLTSASGLELGFDERGNAEQLANLFKTEHYEAVLHAGDMEAVLPKLIWHLEDLRVGQCYPNYYVARLASKFVKVVLSGAGGDEIFGGYPWRYFGQGKGFQPDEYFVRYYEYWQRLVPDEDKLEFFSGDVRRHLHGPTTFDVFRDVFAGWDADLRNREDCIQSSLFFELKTFLHGLLVVEDKISMAHSLETRVPFLDNNLVDFAVRLPLEQKFRTLAHVVGVDENVSGKRRLYELKTNNGKAVLRKAMGRLISPDITERFKQGFSAPDASWFRGESINYINRLLRDPSAVMFEFLNPNYVWRVLDEHCSGQVNRRLLIWSFLSFEWWCRKFLV